MPGSSRAGGRHLLVPGLINAHFHSPANHLKGAVRSLPLELFMLFESPVRPGADAQPPRGLPADHARRHRDAATRHHLRAGRRLPDAVPGPGDHRRGGVGLPRQRDPGLPRPGPTGADRSRKAAVRQRTRRPPPAALFDAAGTGRRRAAARGLRPPDRHLARRRRRPDPRRRVDLRAATRQPGLLRRAGRPGAAPRPAAVRAHAGDQGAAHPDDRATAVRRPLAGPIHRCRRASQTAHQRHPRGLGRRRRPRRDRRRRFDRRAQPGQQPAPGQRRAAVAGHARPRHPGRARHRRGDLRRHRQRVDGRQDRRPDPQRLRARQRRLADARRDSRRPVAGRRPRHAAATTSVRSRPACSPTWR